jgi:hypothetical protein
MINFSYFSSLESRCLPRKDVHIFWICLWSVCYFIVVCCKISVLVLKAVIHETGNQTVLQMIHIKGNLSAFLSLSFTSSPSGLFLNLLCLYGLYHIQSWGQHSSKPCSHRGYIWQTVTCGYLPHCGSGGIVQILATCLFPTDSFQCSFTYQIEACCITL